MVYTKQINTHKKGEEKDMKRKHKGSDKIEAEETEHRDKRKEKVI